MGANERGAFELGFSPAQTLALEKIAHDQLAVEVSDKAINPVKTER